MTERFWHIVGTDQILSSAEGTEIRRTVRLSDVPGSAEQQAVLALNELPDIGSAHPAMSVAFLVSRIVRALDVSCFDAELIYRTRDATWDPGGQFELAAQVTSFASQYDVDGLEIATQSGTEVQRHVIDRPWPLVVFRWRRVTTNLGTAIAQAMAQGRVNQYPWMGAPEHHILCAHVEIEPLYPGHWLQTFEFHLNPAGWDATVTHQEMDIETGKLQPIENPTPDEQITRQVILGFDFASLGLRVQ